MNNQDRAEALNRLLMEQIDGELTLEQQIELMTLLHDDPAALARYAEYRLLDSHLAWEQSQRSDNTETLVWSFGGSDDRGTEIRVRTETGTGTEPQPEIRATAARRRWSRHRIDMALAAALLAIVIPLGLRNVSQWCGPIEPKRAGPGSPDVHAATRSKPTEVASRTEIDKGTDLQTIGVAILTRAVNVVWEDGATAHTVGSPLGLETLRFRSGSLQIEFYSERHRGGRRTRRDRAEGDRPACLPFGKAPRSCASSRRGFRVAAPTVDLVDLGTEFGMQVVSGSKSDVYVFDGKVELYETATQTGRATPTHWETGRGTWRRIGTDGVLIPLAATSPNFLGSSELERLYQKDSSQRYIQWVDRSRRLRDDERLVSYFSFEDDRHPGSRVLVNAGGDRSMDGAIVGCDWVEGRWPGKGALEFKRPSDRVRIRVPGEFASLTLAAWVRIDAIEHRFSSLMLTNGFDPGECHWQIDCFGRIVLGVRAAPARPYLWKNYESPSVLTPETFGRWTHLVTVYDQQSGQVVHYVNGAPIGSVEIVRQVTLRIGDAELGNWGVVHVQDVGRDTKPYRNLCGRMDEFALFRVALDPDEVQHLYQMGKPDQ